MCLRNVPKEFCVSFNKFFALRFIKKIFKEALLTINLSGKTKYNKRKSNFNLRWGEKRSPPGCIFTSRIWCRKLRARKFCKIFCKLFSKRAFNFPATIDYSLAASINFLVKNTIKRQQKVSTRGFFY